MDEAQAVIVEPDGLKGFLGVPDHALGLIIFAHGSGSGRLSPRNNYVAAHMRRAGLATLLIDLLTEREEMDRRNVFDIPLLAKRLARAAEWVRSRPDLRDLPIGYFGASTGGGAALLAASAAGSDIAAVVSRGGRPDLAGGQALRRVRAPTLLIVGGADTAVIELNREATRQMACECAITLVPGATHLFEEAGALDEVVRQAVGWFVQHMGGAAHEWGT